MSVDFKLPDLGEGIHEAEIVTVKIKAGDEIKEDQIMFEVETDKALVEIPSPFSGIVLKVFAEAGKTITVGSVMVSVDNSSASTVTPAKEDTSIQNKTPATETGQGAKDSQSTAAANSVSSPLTPQAVDATNTNRIILATPATRRLARELGVDLRQIVAAGPGGRVFDNDVRTFAASGSQAGGSTTSSVKSAETKNVSDKLPDFSAFGEIERVPLRSIRRKTAENMTVSWENIPHVTHFDEADVTDLDALRAKHEKATIERGGKLTLTVFILKAITNALIKYPQFNSSLDQAKSELIYKRYYNVGVAVASERGLIVPVVKNANQKSIFALALELSQIVEKTRSGKVELESLHGGTFTITNVGTIGGTGMVPMINYPEAAILGIAKAKLKPVVKDGKVEIRLMVPLALAFDHRINDGAEAAYFMNHLIRQLEEPSAFVLEA